MSLKNRTVLTSDSMNVESGEINAKIIYPNPFTGSGRIEAYLHREVDNAILDVVQDLIDSSLNFITDKASPVDVDNNKWVPSDDPRLSDERVPINNSVSTIKIQDLAVTTNKLADDSVTNIKLANMPSYTIKGNSAMSTVDPQDLTPSQVRMIINVQDGANNYIHPNHTGDISSVADGLTTINANVVTNLKLSDVPALTIKGNSLAVLSDPQDLTAAQVRTIINVQDGAQVNYTGINSIQVTGASYELVNDTLTPGNGMVYGTNNLGNRGWYPATSLAGTDNWGTQVAQVNSTLTGNGTSLSPLGIAQQGAVNGQTLLWNGATWLPGTISVEATSASNLGSGAQVFESEVGNDLRFRSLISASSSIDVAQSASEVRFSLIPGNINLSTLSGVLPLNLGGTGIAAASASQALNALLPTQTGFNGYILGTNGSNASWQPATSMGAVNLGIGSPVFNSISGSNLQFNSILAGTAMSNTVGGGNITVNWTGLTGVSSPLSGVGTAGNPLKINNGTVSGQVLTWNGGTWVAQSPSLAMNPIVAYIPGSNLYIGYSDLSTCIADLDTNYSGLNREITLFSDIIETTAIVINSSTKFIGNGHTIYFNGLFSADITTNTSTSFIDLTIKSNASGPGECIRIQGFNTSKIIFENTNVDRQGGTSSQALIIAVNMITPILIKNCIFTSYGGAASIQCLSGIQIIKFLGTTNLTVDVNAVAPLIGTTINYGIIVDPATSNLF